MVKQFLKKKSKRQTTRTRYKIEKKVRDHNRKLKRLDKQKKKGKKGRKLVIVPGDCPFKEKILQEATLLKENILKEKLDKKEQAKALRNAKKAELKARKASPNFNAPHNPVRPTIDVNKALKDKPRLTFDDLVKTAEERGYQFEYKGNNANANSSLKAFYREFQTVVNEADVVIQVLDSRDPLGTRSQDAEDAVRSGADRKLLLALNKCDLVPPENLQKWIAYLKQTTGCAVLPFKANTQKQKDRLGCAGAVNSQKGNETKKSIGVNDLMGLLGVWSRGSAGGITVGVIGMPNVGKSSLINSLKRSKACNVGAKPGITRTCQVISLDSKIKLIDSPGICFSKETGNEAISLEKILARVPKATLLAHYNIPDFQDPEEFLCNIAMKHGQLKKGGIPNTAAAESKLVQDWHTGAIRFYTEPPELPSNAVSSAIVTTMAPELSLDNFSSAPDTEIEMADADAEAIDSETMEDDKEESDEDEEESDEPTSSAITPSPRKPSPRLTRSQARKKGVTFSIDTSGTELIRRRKSLRQQHPEEEAITPKAQQKLGLTTTKKVLMKKIKKSRKKVAKKADELSDVIQNMSF